jgi:magnesium-transporting ATPase (P-type)
VHYRKTVEEIFGLLSTAGRGLSPDEARRRLDEYGPNEIKEKEAEPLWKLILHQFVDPLVVILLIAAVFTTAIGHFVDSVVILVVVLVNGTIGFFQEYKADKAMQALKRLAAPKATVVRDDREERIDAREIVPGDIVILSAGNRIPADIRLFEIRELEIDESMLTGESVPVSKTSEAIAEENLPLADWKNMAFMGTVITHGRGKGIVVLTGEKTELGKISEQVKETIKVKTPLQQRLVHFTRIIGVVSLALAGIVVAIGLLKGMKLVDLVLFAISMAVAVIPEGLPIVITITMAVGLKRMADKNAIIRKLIAVETLGSCDYICSDKTGTITENRMTVTCAWAEDKFFAFTGGGYAPEGKVLLNEKEAGPDEDLKKLMTVGALCNTSNLYFDKDTRSWEIDGMPTEGALLAAAGKYGLDLEALDKEYELVDEIPFSSARKYMATLYRHDGKHTLFVKGAPEKLTAFAGRGQDTSFTRQYTRMAEEGLRVLGFGYKEFGAAVPESFDLERESTGGLTFAGFQGIIDPPRESAMQAIRDTHDAGVNVVMITGDNKITAAAIARQVNILEEGDMVVTGPELDTSDESFLRDNVERIAVYARVSPAHKIRIVEALQARGHITAMTGDGVNDAPALKKSNIGVAMGKAGTDVAREAADMVLKDDNFASIFEAVKVGRVIFDNIQKVSFFLLSSGAGIAFAIIAALLFDWPLPFLATQVLWINLVTNGLQDVSLAYEPGEEDIHKRPPRDPKENIISYELLTRIVFVGIIMMIGTLILFRYQLVTGATEDHARTMAFNTIVLFQFFHAWNSRSLDKSVFRVPFFSNPFLLISLVLSLGAQISVLTFDPLQYVFKTTQLSFQEWGLTALVALSVVIVVELDKSYRRKKKAGK